MGDDELTAENVAMMAAERLQRVDGFGPWGQATWEDVWTAGRRGQVAASINIYQPDGQAAYLYLTAEPVPTEYTVTEFDWGDRADRDRDAAIDRENGVTP